MTIRVPRSITPCVVDVSSFFTALNGFTIGESHLFVLIASWSAVSAASALVALIISCNVIALGTQF